MDSLVLLIDRNIDLQSLLISQLEAAGFRATSAESPEEAISMLAQGLSPLAIVCAMNFPGIGGEGFVRFLSSNLNLRHLPVILFSGRCETEEIARKLGIKGIRKGSTESFFQVIEEIKSLERQRLRGVNAIQ